MEYSGINSKDLVRLHEGLVSASGGLQGILNEGFNSLEMRADLFNQAVSSSLAEFAAFYLSRLAKGHYFVDGNKRTAFFGTRYILARQGMDIDSSDTYGTVSKIEKIAGADSMEKAFEHANGLINERMVNGILISDFDTFYRIVVKGIGAGIIFNNNLKVEELTRKN